MANEMRLDLIDRQAFIEDIKAEIVNLYFDGLKGTPRPTSELYDIIDRINEQTTVDAVPVVHGRWISVEDSLFPGTKEKCSLCGVHKGAGYVYHYCPNCGAKMDGGNEDG